MSNVNATLASGLPDRVTLIAISCLAYILAVALHEHGGHAAACVLLGSRPAELGAFYVNCDEAHLSSLDSRLVAIAGPVVSLFIGIVAFAVLAWLPARAAAAAYFTWLLGTIALLEAAGYPLFSGISGVGDLGTAEGGALFGASPQWLWRLILAAGGIAAYLVATRIALARLEPRLSGEGVARLTMARRAASISYFTGAATYLVIGIFNPYGWTILLLSVLPSSLGGTSGLLWMFNHAPPARRASGPGLYFARQRGWITAGVLITVIYALIFARTLRF